MQFRVFLFILLISELLFVSADPDITFHGFTEDRYIYYTNGDNMVAELNCTVSSDMYDANEMTVTWFYKALLAINPDEDTGTNVIRFEDVATELYWKSRIYYCRAFYGPETFDYENSNDIVVDIKYNTTITVSFDDTTQIREIENSVRILIPVMTDNVVLYCDADTAKWSYTLNDGDREYKVDNPLTIHLFTLQYSVRYDCTNGYDTDKRGFVKQVTLHAIGSGLYKQQQDTYTELSEEESILITEDVTLVCVSSTESQYVWYYRGDMNTGTGDRLTEETEQISSRGFLKLYLPRDLPANRTGYYYCYTSEYISETTTQYREHSILVYVSIPTTTTQTPTIPTTTTTQTPTIPTTTTQTPTTPTTTKTTMMPSSQTTPTTSPTTGQTQQPSTTTLTTTTTPPPPPSVSIYLSYMPDYNTVFIGYDDVTITCVVTTDSIANLTILLVDATTDSILKSQIGNHASVLLDLVKGNITHKCSVMTDTGFLLGEESADLRVEDIYTQEVINLHTLTPSDRGVILVWETSYPQLANESYIISVYSVNESIQYEDMSTLTEYSLTELSYTFHYSISVQVLNRLNNTNNYTQIYYIHNQLITTSPVYGVIGLLAGILIILVLIIIVAILVIILVLKRRKANKSGYSKQIQTNNEQETSPATDKQYINLSDVRDSPNSKPSVLPPLTKKPVYKKLTPINVPVTRPLVVPPENKDGYMTLDQLEVSLEPRGSDKGDDSGLGDNGLHREAQYENVRENLYQSTCNKYADDPHAILVPLSEYKNHLTYLLSECRMEKEYRMFGGQGLRYDCTHALLPVNKPKNKYKLIYPYDTSRVVLESGVESDYINAAIIPGFHLSDTFIATQAPKTNTEIDFWEMILEQRVCTIVMLTRVVEMGKEKSTTYWPKVVGSSLAFNKITVTLHREDTYPCYIVRELDIGGSGIRNYRITQFHYTTWPDHDVPQLYLNLLEFTQKVKQHRNKERAHLLVHCSAGVGRTGTFISLYNLLEGVNVGDPISVYRVVNEMREYRPQMVQTFNQYKFIYLAILELIFGTTSIPSGDFCDTYKLYQQSLGESSDIFKEQFQELNYQSDCSFCYPQTAGREPSNECKNVVKDILPYDTNRVILYSPKWPCEYINASYMDSYELIATLLPTENTMQDFLQLVYQLEEPLVVLLFTQDEYQKVRSGASDRVCYWSEENGRKDFPGFSVITEKSQNSSFLTQQKMKVFSSYENDEHSFTQFISPIWEETGRVSDVVGVLTLLEIVSKQQRSSQDKKVLICCSDGIGKSGVLLTVYNAIRGVQANTSVDVFQAVKQLRNSRRNMVPTLEHYLSCYHLINEYCQMNI